MNVEMLSGFYISVQNISSKPSGGKKVRHISQIIMIWYVNNPWFYCIIYGPPFFSKINTAQVSLDSWFSVEQHIFPWVNKSHILYYPDKIETDGSVETYTGTIDLKKVDK